MGFDGEGWLALPQGAYLLTFNEVVNLPADLMALGRPRSQSAAQRQSPCTRRWWDAGYRGRFLQSLLTVHHPDGFRIQRNARVAQLVFFRLAIPAGARLSGAVSGRGVVGGKPVGFAVGVGQSVRAGRPQAISDQ